MNEYIIWGIGKGDTEESLLISEGKLESLEHAERVLTILVNECGCTKVRIQTINLSDGFNNAFIRTIN